MEEDIKARLRSSVIASTELQAFNIGIILEVTSRRPECTKRKFLIGYFQMNTKVSLINTELKFSNRTSLVAYYTSYHWFIHGLAHRIFTTKRASFMYYAVWPLVKMIEIFGGVSLSSFLLQRHLVIDALIEQEIKKHRKCVVLEIGSGYSARGYRFLRRHEGRNIDYIELDLPGVISEKRRIVEKLPAAYRPHLQECDLNSENTTQSLEFLMEQIADKNYHLIVISEGVVDYMSMDSLQRFWRRLATNCRRFDTAVYITDLTPRSNAIAGNRYVRIFEGALRKFAREPLTRNFRKDDEIRQTLLLCDFDDAEVINPSKYDSLLPKAAKVGVPIVRVARAQVARFARGRAGVRHWR